MAVEEDYSSLCEAAATAFQLVDQVAAGVVQLVNSGGEHRIACHRGCNTCCTVFVKVTSAEAAVIAGWLLAPERAGRLERFREQMAGWNAAIGPEVAFLEGLVTKDDGPPPAGPEGQPFAEACRAYHRRNLMCPFNAGGDGCEIYPIRPTVCRAFFVADTSAHCGLDPKGEVAIVRHAKLTEIALLARRVLRKASAAAGHDAVSALPAGVERALAVLEGAQFTGPCKCARRVP